jgi:hypothetical protein
MEYLKSYKVFEKSDFIDKDDVDELLDKISSSGIESLSDIDKNRLTLFSEGDKEIIETIEKMADITLKFKELNNKLKELSENGVDGFSLFKKEWGPLNDKLRPLEQSFRKWGIELGDYRLDKLMRKVRPDAYNNILESKSNLKFTKKEKKKGAKTDTYDVSKSGTVIGQIKWSSRMRGYAFLPTTDCDNEIKEFVKELMKKRREEK